MRAPSIPRSCSMLTSGGAYSKSGPGNRLTYIRSADAVRSVVSEARSACRMRSVVGAYGDRNAPYDRTAPEPTKDTAHPTRARADAAGWVMDVPGPSRRQVSVAVGRYTV